MNQKILASLTAGDTNPHESDLSSIFPKNTKAIEISVTRVTGSAGFLRVYPWGGANAVQLNNGYDISTVGLKYDRILMWGLTVANNAFDVYCYGYWVEEESP